MPVNIHEKYIKRCIEIAKNGLGYTRPNPMVGCVISHNHNIIGEGFTSPYGGNHAEVNAIASVSDKTLLKESTLYVTLEPCSHYGKTPPCANLIVSHQIPKVVIGTLDTHSKVSGNGIEILKSSGCDVTVGVLEEECKSHHKRFFTFHNKKRPYIILKWAESNDGFIAPSFKTEQKPVWISNEISRQLVHKWRAEEHAILVGATTVLSDNPSLTVRDWAGQNPVRIVLDRYNNLPKNSGVFNKASETIVISEHEIDFNNNIASQVCNFLFKEEIQSVIIEGGSKTLQLFIDENLWDEARIFKGNMNLKTGVKGPVFSGTLISETQISKDVLKTYMND